MNTALYFPFTVCKDKSLIKSALFLFDELEYIVPWVDYEKDRPIDDTQIRTALELIGRPIIPTPNEQKAAHKEISQVCKGKIAKKLNFKPSRIGRDFLIFPQKFDWATWELLKKKKLAKQLGEDVHYDYLMTSSLGHFLMAMLALACSHGKKQLITDSPDAYKALYLSSGDDVRATGQGVNDGCRQLLNIRMKGFDFSRISFSRLLDLRANESSLLIDLRQNYLKTIQECVAEVEYVSGNTRETNKCIESYTKRAERDLKELKRALRVHAATMLLSKTFISTVAGIASEAVIPSSGFLASSLVLTGQLVSYHDKRRELLKRHRFAWLYEAGSKYKIT